MGEYRMTNETGGVYIASKAKHAGAWRALRFGGVPVTSSWIDEAGPGETTDPEDLWKRVEREIARSDGLILVVEEGDGPLNGALVEVGIAIGYGVPVKVVDPYTAVYKPTGFVHHPLVSLAPSIDAALRSLLLPPYPPAGAHPRRRRPSTPSGSTE